MSNIQQIDTSWINPVQKLPPQKLIAFKTLSSDQNFQWQQNKNRWHYIGQYLEYCQLKQAGYLPSHPLEALPEVVKGCLIIEGDYLLALLQIMIDGWEIIKATAIKEGRNFDFDCPRSLFIEACKQEAEFTLKHCLNDGYDSTNEAREYFRQSNAFYRDRLETKEHDQWMEVHKTCNHWSRFVLYATWQHKHTKLKKSWEIYLKAYKKITAMNCDKNFFTKYGVVAESLQWRSGKAFSTKNGSPVLLR
jgi:hypothetical protein